MKIVNVVVICAMLFFSAGFASAVSFTGMADITIDNNPSTYNTTENTTITRTNDYTIPAKDIVVVVGTTFMLLVVLIGLRVCVRLRI